MKAILPVLDVPRPFVLAHRGFDLDGLENSMRAFEAAVRLGVPFLETDVHATADGVLVAFHDIRLDRLTDGHGQVAQLPWREVSRARIGGREPIPQLAEVLAAWPDVRLNVDIKALGAVAPFVRAVRQAKARERVVVASFSDRRRALAVRGLAGEGPVAWSPGWRVVARVLATVRRGSYGVAAALGGAACLQVPERFGVVRIVTPALVDAVHAAGAQVHVWTVDDPVTMRRLLDLGVDGIVTNRADLAIELVRAGSASDDQGRSLG
ncbi:MAG TPA: glycerophosphodiester phosphodiesterase family protein [Dermatophilaceae bacterium]|nr:glycerophosphodiester phosphodiesterase family protein [Dermatophilaceae bacterium]